MDFYESLFKYDLEIQNKLSTRLNIFLQNIQNPNQAIEYSKTVNNIHFFNTLNQIIEEINQSNILKSKICSEMNQKNSKKYIIFAKNTSEIAERKKNNLGNRNNFNQKFFNTEDKKSKIISDINKIICDSIKTNVRQNFLVEINNNLNSPREHYCSEKDTTINFNLNDEINDNDERENITTYKYIPNNNPQNNHMQNKYSIHINSKNDFKKNFHSNSKSPSIRNLINISGKNIKPKQQTANLNSHNNRLKKSINNFYGISLRLKDYKLNNNVINNDIKSQNSIKFDELDKKNIDKKSKFYNNNNAFIKKFDEILQEKKNTEEWNNKKIYEKGDQKIYIKNIRLNKNINNNVNTNNENTANNNINKKIDIKKENVNNSISDHKKGNKKQCLSPDDISRNKKIHLIKFKVKDHNLNLEINTDITNNIAILNNKFNKREKSEKNKNAITIIENSGKNIINRDLINKKNYLIRNYNTIMNNIETEHVIKKAVLKKSHSREINVNKNVIKNLVDKNDYLKFENKIKNAENKKRLLSVNEKRILSSKIHIRKRKEENKFMFWN